MTKTFQRPAGHNCKVTTNVVEQISFGRGRVDNNGFWEIPCFECAQAWKEQFPEMGSTWPMSKEQAEENTNKCQGKSNGCHCSYCEEERNWDEIEEMLGPEDIDHCPNCSDHMEFGCCISCGHKEGYDKCKCKTCREERLMDELYEMDQDTGVDSGYNYLD